MSAAESAKIVIIGGGAVGCGVAYQLALAGKRDILLLEKESSVAAATSSQAAGLVGQVRSTVERIKLAQWSVATFSQMQQDPDTNPSWRQVGSLRVALCQERVAAFEKLATVAAEADLDVEFIDPARAKGLWPALDFSAAQAILYCPSDGYLQPYDLTMAYVKKCRQMGVRFETSRAATGLTLSGNRVTGVQTAEGTIECETVINAAGAHAYHVACWAGMELPIVPVRHEFLITVQCEGMDPQLPVVRIPGWLDLSAARGRGIAARGLGTGFTEYRSAKVHTAAGTTTTGSRLRRAGLFCRADATAVCSDRAVGNSQRV